MGKESLSHAINEKKHESEDCEDKTKLMDYEFYSREFALIRG